MADLRSVTKRRSLKIVEVTTFYTIISPGRSKPYSRTPVFIIIDFVRSCGEQQRHHVRMRAKIITQTLSSPTTLKL